MTLRPLIPIHYQAHSTGNYTSFAGLPFFIDMAKVSGLCEAISQKMNIKERGWTDQKIILSLVLLNISGGDCVDDIDRLESDDGLRNIMLKLETHGMKRKERRAYERRFRKNKSRAFPSATSIRDYLDNFHNIAQEEKRVDGTAFIPESNSELKALCNLNPVLVNFMQKHNPQHVATLDQDATLCETSKSNALYCYKKFKAYQPFNTYWSEQKIVLHSEFRDGNVPAGFEQLRLLKESLNALPESVNKVYLRSDSAGYQQNVLSYCAEGQNEKLGVIEFAISASITKGLKTAISSLTEEAWSPVYKTQDNGKQIKTNQEWAEVSFTPGWIENGAPTYRYIAIREQLIVQEVLEGVEAPQKKFPFQTSEIQNKDYKIFAIATNRDINGNDLINWHRERCGDSEKIHSIEKTDLAGGQFPSNQFGSNAAWWCVMVLSLNLLAIMQQLSLPKSLSNKRIKSIRFHFVGISGKVITHAGSIIMKISGGDVAAKLFHDIQRRISQLTIPPPIPHPT